MSYAYKKHSPAGSKINCVFCKAAEKCEIREKATEMKSELAAKFKGVAFNIIIADCPRFEWWKDGIKEA